MRWLTSIKVVDEIWDVSRHLFPRLDALLFLGCYDLRSLGLHTSAPSPRLIILRHMYGVGCPSADACGTLEPCANSYRCYSIRGKQKLFRKLDVELQKSPRSIQNLRGEREKTVNGTSNRFVVVVFLLKTWPAHGIRYCVSVDPPH